MEFLVIYHLQVTKYMYFHVFVWLFEVIVHVIMNLMEDGNHFSFVPILSVVKIDKLCRTIKHLEKVQNIIFESSVNYTSSNMLTWSRSQTFPAWQTKSQIVALVNKN